MQIAFDPADTGPLSAAFRAQPLAPGIVAVFAGGRRSDRQFAAWLMAGELDLPLVESIVPVAGCVTFIERTLPAADTGGGPVAGGVSVSTNVDTDPTDGSVGASGSVGLNTPIGGVSLGGGVAVGSSGVTVTVDAGASLFGGGVSGGGSVSTGPDGTSASASAGATAPTITLPASPLPGLFGLPGWLSAAPPNSVVIWSLDDRWPALEMTAAFTIVFPSKGRRPLTPPPAASPGDAHRVDANNCFDVQIDDESIGFASVSGLSCDSRGSRGTIYPRVVLRRAIGAHRALYDWRMNIAAGRADVRSMTITHLAPEAGAIRVWWIEGAWPVRWSGPSFDALASDIAMEEIEICITRCEWR